MDDHTGNSNFDDLGWGWSRANVIACAVLALAVLALVAWQWSGSRHHLGADITIEQEMVEKVSAMLDPNTASAAELMSLPGIGPSLAEQIVSYREEFNKANPAQPSPFASLDDLQKVRGIGPKKSQQIGPYLEFENQKQDTQSR